MRIEQRSIARMQPANKIARSGGSSMMDQISAQIAQERAERRHDKYGRWYPNSCRISNPK